MISYKHTKQDGSIWLYFYDRSIKFWTVYQIDQEGNQISEAADYYQNKVDLLKEHNEFNFTPES